MSANDGPTTSPCSPVDAFKYLPPNWPTGGATAYVIPPADVDESAEPVAEDNG